jgi:hypothetical protein
MPQRKTRKQLPRVGTVLVGKSHGKQHRATVISADEPSGRVMVIVGRRQFASLSAAAKAVTGHDVNGWVFWGVDQRP